jgi:hypothetical protein
MAVKRKKNKEKINKRKMKKLKQINHHLLKIKPNKPAK